MSCLLGSVHTIHGLLFWCHSSTKLHPCTDLVGDRYLMPVH